MVKLNNDWDELLADEFAKPYYQALRQKLKFEYKNYKIYPDMYDIFNALKFTSYNNVKVVILGQDPYHGEGQAHGLSFSVKKGINKPPSLINIFKEIGIDSDHGCLDSWAKQGVLLLNSTLTVRAGQANSHQNLGWAEFTDNVIRILDARENPIVFLLWGSNARNKARSIRNPKHLIMQTVHPSPLSAHNGFFGCNHFNQANAFLEKVGETPIDWKNI